MKIPKRHVGSWAKEIIDECSASRPQRITTGNFWKALYFTGDPGPNAAVFNKTYAHIDRLGSFLYSPTEVRFNMIFDFVQGEPYLSRSVAAARHLTREFAEGDVDMKFAEALQWALIKGSSFLKVGWEHNGLAPYL